METDNPPLSPIIDLGLAKAWEPGEMSLDRRLWYYGYKVSGRDWSLSG